jgi:selenocysteine lyase/cysteine desulfurase
VARTGIAGGPAIRVTPGFFTTPEEVDALAKAIQAEHGMFA